MAKANAEIYQLISQKGLRCWQVAYEMGLHDSNFVRLLRKPLTSERRQQVMAAIEKLSKEAAANG
jgi:hypothetical protein